MTVIHNTSSEDDDWRLLSCVRDNPAALGTLFERHKDYVFRLAWGVLGNRVDAEDTVQQVFSKLAEPRLRWAPRAKFRTWLYRVAINTAREIGRQHMRSERLAGALRAQTQTVVEDAAIAVRMEELPERQREVVVLRFLEGFSTTETAKILGTREGTVKTHLHRATRRLQSLLAPTIDHTNSPPLADCKY